MYFSIELFVDMNQIFVTSKLQTFIDKNIVKSIASTAKLKRKV